MYQETIIKIKRKIDGARALKSLLPLIDIIARTVFRHTITLQYLLHDFHAMGYKHGEDLRACPIIKLRVRAIDVRISGVDVGVMPHHQKVCCASDAFGFDI